MLAAMDAVWPRLGRWMRRGGIGAKLAIGLAFGAVISAIVTYGTITGATPARPSLRLIWILFGVNAVLVLALAVLVARRLLSLWAARRSGHAGSKLHLRLVALFSIVAIVPAIIVAVFSAVLINVGIQAWFSERVRTVVEHSVQVAESYVQEHRKVIRADLFAMANDLNRAAPLYAQDPKRFEEVVATQAALRSLSEAYVIDSSGHILAQSNFSFSFAFQPPPPDAIEAASRGEVVTLTNDYDSKVQALMRLDQFIDAYLYVGRFVDARVLDHVRRAREAVAEYQRLEGRSSHLQLTFALTYSVMALLILLAAIWFGLWLANRLVAPITSLVNAAERVSGGDLAVRVDEKPGGDEIATLSRAFNHMTGELERQHGELIAANRQVDDRRRFMETVLSGVTAGVIGLDPAGRVTLPNRTALQLLVLEVEEIIGEDLAACVPEMAELLADARMRPERVVQGQVTLTRAGQTRTLLVRVVSEQGARVQGYVVTFDDITMLVSAQRSAAWADVARRVAHEIKNPLTPIQLSAERLRRKYQKEIVSDPETFERCTQTIIRQVTDIGRMVDEFSTFARMPGAVMREEDVTDIVRQVVFLQHVSDPAISFETEFPDGALGMRCDRRQVSQVVINVVKNAVESVQARRAEQEAAGAAVSPGQIVVGVSRLADGRTVIEVLDNGRGLPAQEREKLTEPYVTTRTKGSGLGLAIAKKVMDDHGGELSLDDRADSGETGAVVRLIFPATAALSEPGTKREETLTHGA